MRHDGRLSHGRLCVLRALSAGGLILACSRAAAPPSPPTSPSHDSLFDTGTPNSLASDTPPPGSAAPCSASAAKKSDAQAEAPAELRVRLRPVPNEDGGVVEVTLEASGPAQALRSWRLPQLAGTLDVRVTARAERCGRVGATQQLQGAGGQVLGVSLPEGAAWATLRLEYNLPPQRLAAPFWRLEPDWFLGQGGRFLVLPEDRSWSADVRVEIDADRYGQGARGVSSLGLVPAPPALPKPVRMTLPALEHALFAAGKLGSAQFVAREGHDDAAWFGSIGFDVRLLAAEVASFRTAVREVLLDLGSRELTLLVVSDLQQGFEARRAPVSVLARVAPGEPLTPGLRLDVLQQVLKEWIGGQLSVQDQQGVEPLWFSEGFSRFLARELALEFGLITPEEFAGDVNALMAVQAVLGQHECARREHNGLDAAAGEDGAVPRCKRALDAARGILHATQLDTALRGRRSSLVQLLAGLLEARNGPQAAHGALTLKEWRTALEGAGGAAALRVHDEFLAAGERTLLLPGNAFGACFVREPARYAESLLSFALARPEGGTSPLRVTSVDSASPAEAAGLRPDALLQHIEHVPYDPRRAIRLTLQDGLMLEYRGAQRQVPGYAWRRVPAVKDERCRMSGREYPSAR